MDEPASINPPAVVTIMRTRGVMGNILEQLANSGLVYLVFEGQIVGKIEPLDDEVRAATYHQLAELGLFP